MIRRIQQYGHVSGHDRPAKLLAAALLSPLAIKLSLAKYISLASIGLSGFVSQLQLCLREAKKLREQAAARQMMSSRERKKAAALQEKLQILRSITHSHALSNTSIILDASKYIKELKQKAVRLNQEIACAQDTLRQNRVTVETLGHGFLVNVFSGKSCPGLLVSILEAFDELGLSVLEATASCADTFRLEAIGGENLVEKVDENVVKQAVLRAIRSCSGSGGGGDHGDDDEEE
uniref:Plant bHLH transcription factor ACT-like domain-containing protein n=1 Tax=Leersia perrieri TaxID=77586 RepID=A0A0D9VTT9_9ORYZ